MYVKQIKFLKRVLAVVLTLSVLLSTVIISGIFTSEATGNTGYIDRFIDYDKYTEMKNTNTYFSETDKTTLWQNVVYDETVSGGAYLAVKGNPDMGPFTNWSPHHTIVMTESGYHNTTSGDPDNLSFPTNTTFRVTLKIRAKDYSNFYLGIRYGSSYASSSGTAMDSLNISNMVVKNEWTEISYVFTTPTAYNGDYTKCFLTLTSSYWDSTSQKSIYREEYDLDWIHLEQITGSEAYNEVGETYTFDFNEGSSAKTYAANSGTSVDADGTVFYPLHSTSDATTAEQVSVETADGTIGALKMTNAGQTSFIPVDANGKPYMIDPNAKYQIKINAYTQYMGIYDQAFFGGGAGSANSATYTQYNNTWNGSENMLFPGTDKTSAAGITSNYALYKTDSFMYTETGGNYYASEANAQAATTKQRVRYYSDTTAMPKYSTTLWFTTLDYTEDTTAITNNTVTANRPANTITVTGYKRSDETVTATNTYGTYFCITMGGGSITPWASNGDGTATKVGDTQYQTIYIDSISITKLSQTVSVAFDANGGTFSDGSTALVAETQYVGSDISPSLEVSTTAGNTFLQGWSLSADGSTGVYSKVTTEMHNKTVYAIWLSDPHAGGYNPVTRYIDYSGYSVIKGTNSYYDGDINTVDGYFKVIEDETATGGHYLQYYNYAGSSNWRANWNITMTASGKVDTTGDTTSPDSLVFPNNTLIKVTMRIRVNDLGGNPAYAYVLYGSGNACSAFTSAGGTTNYPSSYYYNYEKLVSNITETNGEWVDLVLTFTTPSEYTTADGYTYDKCFIGICQDNRYAVKYDIDTITIEQQTATNLYVKNGDSYELLNTVYGVPGYDLTLPTEQKEEVYASDGTGYEKVTAFDGWYSDEDGTKAAVPKFGNFEVDLYCPSTTVTTSSTAGQFGFVGFDEYFELAEGMSLNPDSASITTDEAYTGASSLKLELNGGSSVATELKNNVSFDIKNGKSYKVVFSYKAEKDFTASVLMGELGNIAGGKNLNGDAKINLTATESWQTATLTVHTDALKDFARGFALALVAESSEDNTVYFDTVTVYTVTEALRAAKTDDGLRFMFTYNCGGDDTYDFGGTTYTVSEHGVLVTGADNTADITLDNVGESGVAKVTGADLSTYYTRNSVTGTTVYSVALSGLSADDTYGFIARGYVKMTNGDIYYSDYILSSAADAEDAFEFTVPEEAISTGTSSAGNPYETFSQMYDSNAQHIAYFPAGTTFYSDKDYKVERWSSPSRGGSWISPNFQSTGSYTLPAAAYCELTVWNGTLNGDLIITVPAESEHLVRFGTPSTINVAAERTVQYAGDSAINYIFITDIHTGAFLRESSGGYLTVYEAKELVNAREQSRIAKITELVNFANTHDEIDFIVIGGDIVNGYETYLSPMYQEALAAGEVSNVREFVISQIQAVLAPLKNSEKPVFVMPGNHDYNTGQSLFYNAYNAENNITGGASKDLAEIVSPRDWLNGVMKEFINVEVVQDPNYLDTNGDKLSTYYYYDFEKNGEKKRVICLSDMDVRSTMNEDGQITVMGTGYMNYTAEQLQWLAGVLESTEGDIAMFCHQGIDSATKGPNMDVLKNLLAAFQNKTAYKNDSYGIDVDFSDSPSGHIVSYHAGHDHVDMTYYTPGANIWQMLSAAGNIYDIVSATDEVIYKNNSNTSSYDAKLIYPELP